MHKRHVTPRGDGSERGSIIVALMVVMVVTTLTTVVFARTVAALDSVRVNQNSSAAAAQADAGLADALFRIDQYGNSDSTSFCVGSNPTCTIASVPGAPGVSYSAVVVDNDTYQVTSEGTVNHQTHVIQATVQRTPAYPFAIFGTGNVTFNGTGSTIQPTTNGVKDTNRQADVGSNGTVTCNGGGPDGDSQVSYQSSWNGCPSPVSGTGSYQPLDPVTAANCPSPNTNDPPVPCVPASAISPCPATFTGTLTGTYYCTGDVTFSGTITVNGSFSVYLIPPAGSTATVNMSGSSTIINSGGDPRDFAVYMAGAGSVVFGNGSNVPNVTGLIYAPSASVTSNGCQVTLTGALVVGTFTCNGGPNVTINYDSRIAAVLQHNWTVKNYTEIPAAEFPNYYPGF